MAGGVDVDVALGDVVIAARTRFDCVTQFKNKSWQGSGARACDMGDAMVGDALSDFKNLKWFAIRNASDPQISNPSNDIDAAKQQAGEIYAKYGAFTTAASVIATWAVIDAACAGRD